MVFSDNLFRQYILKWYLFLSKRIVIIISLATTAALTLILNSIYSRVSGSSDVGIVYLQLAFSRQSFEMVIANWGVQGIHLFMKTIWLNFAYTLSYCFLLSSAPAHLSLRREDFNIDAITSKDFLFFLLPYVAGLFDCINTILYIIIFQERVFHDLIILSASVAALIKWVLILVSLVFILKSYFTLRKEKFRK